MLQTGQIGTNFVHIVKALFKIVFKVSGWGVHNGNVIIRCHFLAGEIYGTTTAAAASLVWRKLLVIFGPFNKSFGPEPFQQEIIVRFYYLLYEALAVLLFLGRQSPSPEISSRLFATSQRYGNVAPPCIITDE